MSNVTKEFFSTDVGAPQVAGNSGASVTAMLTAVLINGYNSMSVTSLVGNGTTATATVATNSYTVGQCILITGATPSEMNGEKYVTAVTGTTFSYASTTNATATGTITAKVAPLGWTQAFSTTNIIDYQQGSGNLRYFQADVGTAQWLKGSLFETMSAANTGTNQTPSSLQSANFAVAQYTIANNATTRAWYVIGNDRSFYLFFNQDGSTGPVYNSMLFVGDYTSYKSGDLYNCLITGSPSPTTSSGLNGNYSLTVAPYYNTAPTTGNGVRAVLRPYTGIGSSQILSFLINSAFAGSTGGPGATGPLYPSLVDGTMITSPIWLGDGATLRGEMPGVVSPYHNMPLSNYDTFTGAGALAGKYYRAVHSVGYSGSTVGQVFLQRLAPWY